jgi:hypothetical protein
MSRPTKNRDARISLRKIPSAMRACSLTHNIMREQEEPSQIQEKSSCRCRLSTHHAQEGGKDTILTTTMYHRRPSPSPSSSLTSADVTFDGDGGSSVASPSCLSKSSDSSSCGLLYHHFYMVPPLSSSVKDPPVTVVDVEAPASLSEGYVFWATMPQSDHRSRNKNSNRKRSLSSFPVRVVSTNRYRLQCYGRFYKDKRRISLSHSIPFFNFCSLQVVSNLAKP